MDQEHCIAFGPFRLETTQGRLWRGDQVIPLRPRSLAMLRYLVAHPGRLVTKAEVRQHVWVGTHVTDTVLRVSVREIRAALGDAAAPRYLETVGRQGYRCLGGGDLEGPPPAHSRSHCRTSGRRRYSGGVVPACHPGHPSARLR
jgi:DNA-binding winged helix-turn-helix (wHTH) protein